MTKRDIIETTTCDRCGKKITDRDHLYTKSGWPKPHIRYEDRRHFEVIFYDWAVSNGGWKSADLCPECQAEFDKWWNNNKEGK